MEGSLNPLEKYQQVVAHLNELQAAGAIDQQTYAAELDKANRKLHAADDAAANKKAETFERRFDFRLPAKHQNKPDNAVKQIAEQKTTNRLLEKVVTVLSDKPSVASI